MHNYHINKKINVNTSKKNSFVDFLSFPEINTKRHKFPIEWRCEHNENERHNREMGKESLVVVIKSRKKTLNATKCDYE